ncbi:MAG: hypothetical protein AABZ31_07900 [Bdellovibrionota bacterium]
MRLAFLALIFILLGSFAHGTTECIGSVKANRFIVYLHGIDTESPSLQELENRGVLKELAKSLNIRFALPRAKVACPTKIHQMCWTWAAKTSVDLAPVKSAIELAAADCFPSKNYDVLGFSNGGIAVASLLRLCEKVDFNLGITVGAAGGWFSSDP